MAVNNRIVRIIIINEGVKESSYFTTKNIIHFKLFINSSFAHSFALLGMNSTCLIIQIRKVNEAMDGDTITNEPEKLTDLQNNGHYFIVEN